MDAPEQQKAKIVAPPRTRYRLKQQVLGVCTEGCGRPLYNKWRCRVCNEKGNAKRRGVKQTRSKAVARNAKRYSITVRDYKQLWEKQLGLCAICLCALTDDKTTHIDHDHVTGKVRGLLCNLCNMLLGGAKDSTSILNRAIEYLAKRRV